jgi:hypothetical protein
VASSDKPSADIEASLAEFIAGFYDDPYGFVMAVFPWGEPTLADGAPNPLAEKDGPEDWQRDELIALGEHIKLNVMRRDLGLDMVVYKLAIASGHGIGKSAFVAWIIHFLMSTRVDTRMAVTASTQFQLEDKTWPELSKWKQLAINGHWFLWTATTYSFAAYSEDRRKNYRATAATVSETNTEAFQGLHNEGKTVAVVFDEASGVLPKIWEVSMGALTDGEAFFLAFSNPTQPDGEFFDCFNDHKDMYRTQHIDSRSVRFTNKTALQDIIDRYGEDSDEARVRVYGQFPRTSFEAFIPAEAIDLAQSREDALAQSGAALIMGVDGSRSPGGDRFKIRYRQGRDARTIPGLDFPGMNSIEAYKIVSEEANRTKPDAIIVEGTGPTTGLIDLLKHWGYPVIEVYPGATPAVPLHKKFQNNRAYWYHELREWLWEEGVLPNPAKELTDQMKALRYGYQPQTQKLIMESKKEMSARGLPSPDDVDSLMLTFAVKVARRDRNRLHSAKRLAKVQEDVLGMDG